MAGRAQSSRLAVELRILGEELDRLDSELDRLRMRELGDFHVIYEVTASLRAQQQRVRGVDWRELQEL